MKKIITIALGIWIFIVLNIAWTQSTFDASLWSTDAKYALTMGITILVIIAVLTSDTNK